MPDSPTTLCGRIVKAREVDMEWPLCKSCEKLIEFSPHSYTFSDEEIQRQMDAPTPEGQESWPRFIFESFTVQRIRSPKRHKRKAQA